MTKNINSIFIYCTKRIVNAFYFFSLLAYIFLITQCQKTSKSSLTDNVLDSATTIAYYPSLRKLEIRIDKLDPKLLTGTQKFIAKVRLQGKNKTVARQKFSVTANGGINLMAMPALKDGDYEVNISMMGGGPEIKKSFKHKNFPWLGNDLGKKEVIYPPFEAIKVNDNVAQVVLRDYQMNGFGLWNSVKSEGKEILAAPVCLHAVTDAGEVSWQFTKGKWTILKPHLTVYNAEANSSAVRVRTKSSVEYDGCMKVEMDLLPGAKAETIHRLWLEIPLKDEEAPLFHYTTFLYSLRRDYSGKTPRGGKITWQPHPQETNPPIWASSKYPPIWKAEPGSDDGIIWTCRDIYPWEHMITTDFVPYLWLGGGERGLAFFGANDKGYLLDPNGKVQTIERKGETLFLRVDLVNTPSIITSPRHIVFGLQASPTRPMPTNWRTEFHTPAMSGPVVCWGGYVCADKYPDGHDFTVVDEIQKVRQTGKVDMAVFEKLERERAEPWKLQYCERWLCASMRHFISQAQRAHNNPQTVMETYLEEHASDITTKEWQVYQDEWRSKWPWPTRVEIVGQQQPEGNVWGSDKYGAQGFPPSYLDFCLYYANEWMKRGVGLYFDNVVPYPQYNPLLTDAYYNSDGKLQPASSIWEQREYYKRIWTLMHELREKGTPFPIGYTMHVTNSLILPLNTWTEASLGIEWDWYDMNIPNGPTSGLLYNVENGNLHTVPNQLNGVIGNAGVFPTRGNSASNYFRDVVYQSVSDDTPITLFTVQTPVTLNMKIRRPSEIGCKFQAVKDGDVIAIRYWKSPSETGSHTGNIWSAKGDLLSSVRFSRETAAGWQKATLPKPLAVKSDSIYVVSVNANASYVITDPIKEAPFPHDLLLTEVTGRQAGSYPYALARLTGEGRPNWEQSPKAKSTEWGMHKVHEISYRGNTPTTRSWDTALRDFGYGKPEIAVINYWSDDPPVTVNDVDTKWLLLTNKQDGSLLLVLQSWYPEDGAVTITFDPARLGFTPAATAIDLEDNSRVSLPDNKLKIVLTGPYGTKVLKIGN